MLCTHCSFFLKRLLFLSVQCSPAPVCPVFLCVCVPKGPLVHCAQSPMVLKTCCFSDALCPLLLNPTVTLTDPLVTGHWSTVSLFLSSHRPSGLFSGPVWPLSLWFRVPTLIPLVLCDLRPSDHACSLSLIRTRSMEDYPFSTSFFSESAFSCVQLRLFSISLMFSFTTSRYSLKS